MSSDIHYLLDCPQDAADFQTIRLAALRSDPDAFGETYAAVAGMDAAAWAARLRHILARPGNAVLVARSDGQVLGMACFGIQVEDASCGGMWGVYVVEAQRGTGLAGRLIAEGIRWLQGCGLHRLTARVAAPNARAISFYRRLGFAIGPADAVLRPGSAIPVHPISLELGAST
jgi:RimJ/RimL family protein N-acetyltransferase